MNKRGFTLLEILVSTIILALVMTGLANIFVAGKKYILHSRARMTGGELGKLFLDPLQQDVRQDQWGSNCLTSETGCPGAQRLDNITYTPDYDITLDDPVTNLNKVSVAISWPEPNP